MGKRYRKIEAHPVNGGAPCEQDYLIEVGTCTHIHNCGALFCEWADWTDWGKCSAACGKGQKSRRRHLIRSTSSTELESFKRLYDVAEDHAVSLEGVDLRE